jgi:hypothetical protein
MANINFPNNPSVNDEFLVGGKTYVFDGVKWVASTTINKSDVQLGNVQNYSIADQAEAEAGSVNNKYMTPLRTAQAIVELAPDPTIATQAEAETGTDNTVFMTPLRTAQAIGEQALKTTYTTTIATTDTWTDQTGYFTLAKTVSGVTANDDPIADLDLSSATVSNVEDIITAWSSIYRIETTTDTLTFYALEEPDFPENVTISFEVNK